MRAELGQLDVAAGPSKPEPEENKQWEEQLQQELQDLELQVRRGVRERRMDRLTDSG